MSEVKLPALWWPHRFAVGCSHFSCVLFYFFNNGASTLRMLRACVSVSVKGRRLQRVTSEVCAANLYSKSDGVEEV